MSSIELKTPAGETDSTVELPDAVFDATVNIALMHQVVTAQLGAARQGTHDTKTRGEVAGGSKKPYRQKGTGRARQGSERAPQFVGGGVVHGPKPRDYGERTPKKMKAAALRSALSDRAQSGQIYLVTALVSGDRPSTKEARKTLASVTGRGMNEDKTDSTRVLVVVDRSEQLAWRSARNLSFAHLVTPDQLNTYDVLVNDDLVFTKSAYEEFVSNRAGTKTAKAAGTGSGEGSDAQ